MFTNKRIFIIDELSATFNIILVVPFMNTPHMPTCGYQ